MYKIIIIALIVLGLGGYAYIRMTDDTNIATQAIPEGASNTSIEQKEVVNGDAQNATPDVAVHTVIYTNDGYTPKELNIKAGDMVTWVNESTSDMWPATAMHPTHTVYPGSDIAKCSEADTTTLFDACAPVAVGETYSFIFTQEGAWRYHNHLNVRDGGMVTVTK